MKTIRNEADRRALIGRINKLKGDESPLWGRMSIEQMMSHLVQSGDLPFVKSVDDASNFFSRTFVKPLVLYLLPIPKEVKTSAQFDQQQDGRKPQGFPVDRQILIDSIEILGTLPLDQKCLGHPFFGVMNAREWARLAHKHIDHHLRQFGV